MYKHWRLLGRIQYACASYANEIFFLSLSSYVMKFILVVKHSLPQKKKALIEIVIRRQMHAVHALEPEVMVFGGEEGGEEVSQVVQGIEHREVKWTHQWSPFLQHFPGALDGEVAAGT